MQTFLVTVLTFISAALYGPESGHSDSVELETSIKKEAPKPQLKENPAELEAC